MAKYLDYPIYFTPAPTRGKYLTGLWKDSPSQPAAPDYTGAANATSAGNLEAARAATAANRVDQYTPYGSLNYTQTPTDNPDGGWSSTINLSPTGQKLLDYANNASLGLGQQTQDALGRVNDSLAKPFDYGSVKDTQDAAYKSYTDRLDPQWQESSNAMENKLANQGIPVGSEAYDNAMRSFNEGKNDAYSQASQNAINTAPQTYQLAQALRSQPLNELNALRTGSQVTNPTFSAVPQQATTAGPDLLGATNAQYQNQLSAYNAQQAGDNSFLGGLMGLGGQLGAARLMGSDINIKQNITKLYQRPDGLNVYEFEYKPEYKETWGDGKHIGVMAQEVEKVYPDAIHTHHDGYLMVDYGGLQ